jgi:hypothetical protein
MQGKQTQLSVPDEREVTPKRIYLIPVQQEAIHKSPNDTRASSGLGLLLHRRDLCLAPLSDHVTEWHRTLLVEVVMREVAVWDTRDSLDGV